MPGLVLVDTSYHQGTKPRGLASHRPFIIVYSVFLACLHLEIDWTSCILIKQSYIHALNLWYSRARILEFSGSAASQRPASLLT